MMSYVREGDLLHVYTVERLGRDAIDVQLTIKGQLACGVTVHLYGLGPIAAGVGELIIAVLSQIADMERQRINERTASGRELAKASLVLLTGRTGALPASVVR